jgi:hypothetical protein
MTFALFLAYIILTFLRPAEHIPAFRGWPIMDAASVLALCSSGVSLMRGHKGRSGAPQVALTVALVAWSGVTVLVSPLLSMEVFQHVLNFAKSSATAFILVVVNVTTVRRLRLVAGAMTMCGLFLSWQAVSTSREMAGEQLWDATTRDRSNGGYEGDVQSPQGTPSYGDRVFISGLFGDPNDLALTLVAMIPFALAMTRPARPVLRTVAMLLSTCALLYGIYVTRSRGGVLALASVVALLLRGRVGNALSGVAGALVLLGLLTAGFVGDRSMSIDASAEGRIDAWSAGLQMLKHSPLWGVGLGLFGEYHTRAAHSAFVQCFAELGIVGYLLWLALIIVTLDELAGIRSAEPSGREGKRWASATATAIVAFLVGGMFLSRAYDVVLFVLLGLGCAVGGTGISGGKSASRRSVVAWLYVVGAVAAGSIAGLWLYMRLVW